LHHFHCLLTNNFQCLFCIRRKFALKESFRDIFVIKSIVPAEKKDLEHTVWKPFGGIVSFFGGGENSRKDAWNKRWSSLSCIAFARRCWRSVGGPCAVFNNGQAVWFGRLVHGRSVSAGSRSTPDCVRRFGLGRLASHADGIRARGRGRIRRVDSWRRSTDLAAAARRPTSHC